MAYRIDEACNENWDAMELGEQGRRFCQACEHDVIDATNMTKREFEAAFHAASSGKVCARFRANPVGDGIFRRELPRPRALGSFVLLSSLLASACGSEAPLEPEREPEPAVVVEALAEAAEAQEQPGVEAPPEEAAPTAEERPAEPVAAPAPQPVPSTRMGGVRHL
ncbi:MAG: hypothetical protein AB8H86_09240 [Polyangiales bacterium]